MVDWYLTALKVPALSSVTHYSLKMFHPYRFSGFGGVFSLILGIEHLTQEPVLMSLLVHLFFNIQHLTPSVVLKYIPPQASPPDSQATPHCSIILLSLCSSWGSLCFQTPGWWIESVQFFWCIGYSILSFFSSLWWSLQPPWVLSFR